MFETEEGEAEIHIPCQFFLPLPGRQPRRLGSHGVYHGPFQSFFRRLEMKGGENQDCR